MIMNKPPEKKPEDILRDFHQGAGDESFAALTKVAPEFMEYATKLMASVYSRPQLDPRTKEIISITIFTVMGYSETGLETHFNNALNVGLTKETIIEVIWHVSAFAGLVAAANALAVAKRVFESRGLL